MAQPSFELFRFSVGRAARPQASAAHLAPPEPIGFVTLAVERARESPRPSLAEVARAYLAQAPVAALVAGTALTRAARQLCIMLDALPPDPAEDAVRQAMEDSGFTAALAALDPAAARDEVWSALTALHCDAAGDAGTLLALSSTARALALDALLARGPLPALRPLLRAPLALPLSAITQTYSGGPRRDADQPTLVQQVQQRKVAEADQLLTLQGALDSAGRVALARRLHDKQARKRDEPLTEEERGRFGKAELAALSALGVDRAPLAELLGETEAALRTRAIRIAAVTHETAKPTIRALSSGTQDQGRAAATLLQLQSPLLHSALGIGVLPDLLRRVLPEAPPLRSDSLVERLLPRIRPVGVLDLKLVETELRGYQLGEIAHIENVLATEFRERVHKRQDTSEVSTETERETSRENERSLETTERFEMRQEVSNTIAEKMDVTAGVQVSVNGGTFTLGANAGFAYSRSQEEARKFSSEFAKEVVDKTREKVETRVREVRRTMRRTVLDESNTHCFDNTAPGSTHQVGVYRFVDKVLEARLLNYGRRMMFEFMVPEPAAALRNVERQSSGKAQPVPELLIGPAQLDGTNYQEHVGLYGAREVQPPPPEEIVVSAILQRDSAAAPPEGTTPTPLLLTAEIAIPPGYYATACSVSIDHAGTEPAPSSFCVGEISFNDTAEIDFAGMVPRQRLPFPRHLFTEKIPATVLFHGVRQGTATVSIECRRSDGRWQAWQNETFGKIKEAYELHVADVQEANRRLESQQRRGIGTLDPAANRRREREELQRGCINAFNSMLLQGNYFDSVQVRDDGVLTDVDDALREGQAVRFFHTAFEWDHMTYELYPYFWGRRERWAEMIMASHEDSKYEEFLRSGFARVSVPVRPGQETNALNFLKLGLHGIFDGIRETVVDDPEFLHLLADLDEPLDPPVQEGAPWSVVVPTTLVKLQLAGEDDDLGVRGSP